VCSRACVRSLSFLFTRNANDSLALASRSLSSAPASGHRPSYSADGARRAMSIREEALGTDPALAPASLSPGVSAAAATRHSPRLPDRVTRVSAAPRFGDFDNSDRDGGRGAALAGTSRKAGPLSSKSVGSERRHPSDRDLTTSDSLVVLDPFLPYPGLLYDSSASARTSWTRTLVYGLSRLPPFLRTVRANGQAFARVCSASFLLLVLLIDAVVLIFILDDLWCPESTATVVTAGGCSQVSVGLILGLYPLAPFVSMVLGLLTVLYGFADAGRQWAAWNALSCINAIAACCLSSFAAGSLEQTTLAFSLALLCSKLAQSVLIARHIALIELARRGRGWHGLYLSRSRTEMDGIGPGDGEGDVDEGAGETPDLPPAPLPSPPAARSARRDNTPV
jgi:hypothetical protein